jgi:quercetin dioxygenase-like cupin family protein
MNKAPGQNIVEKGWGYEIWLVNTDDYCAKILKFFKGKKCSYHYHKNKTETFIIQKGLCKLKYCHQWYFLKAGDTFHIPCGTEHQVVAIEDTEILEVSTHHEDSDSYRIEKGD